MIAQTLARALSGSSVPVWACVGLLLFLAVFVGAIAWVFRSGSGEFYASLSRMPLESGEKEEA